MNKWPSSSLHDCDYGWCLMAGGSMAMRIMIVMQHVSAVTIILEMVQWNVNEGRMNVWLIKEKEVIMMRISKERVNDLMGKKELLLFSFFRKLSEGKESEEEMKARRRRSQ